MRMTYLIDWRGCALYQKELITEEIRAYSRRIGVLCIPKESVRKGGIERIYTSLLSS